MKSKNWLIVLLMSMFMIVVGCGDDSSPDVGKSVAENKPQTESTPEQTNSPESVEIDKQPDPYEMTIYAAGVSPDEFDRRWRAALEGAFPHITFNYMTNTKGNSLDEVLVTGSIPDLIRIDIPGLKNFKDRELLQDLNHFVTKYDYDLTRFDEAFVQDIIAAGQTGELYGLPVPPYFPGVLYYNIDLLNQFGMDPPVDGMTWDEIYTMAQRLSRAEGDVVYRGISMSLTNVLRDNPFSIPIIHPEEDRLAEQEGWQNIFANIKRFYEIPNNQPPEVLADEARIFNEGTVSLFHGQFNIYNPISEDIHWDMVSVPVYENGPKRIGQRGPAYWTVTAQSKHQDEAFEVMMEMLSDDIQMQDSRNGIVTTLNNEEIQGALGQDDPILRTKNVNAISYYPPSDAPPRRAEEVVIIADGAQTNLVNNTFFKVIHDTIDMNTALREINERLKQMADEERAQQ